MTREYGANRISLAHFTKDAQSICRCIWRQYLLNGIWTGISCKTLQYTTLQDWEKLSAWVANGSSFCCVYCWEQPRLLFRPFQIGHLQEMSAENMIIMLSFPSVCVDDFEPSEKMQTVHFPHMHNLESTKKTLLVTQQCHGTSEGSTVKGPGEIFLEYYQRTFNKGHLSLFSGQKADWKAVELPPNSSWIITPSQVEKFSCFLQLVLDITRAAKHAMVLYNFRTDIVIPHTVDLDQNHLACYLEFWVLDY